MLFQSSIFSRFIFYNVISFYSILFSVFFISRSVYGAEEVLGFAVNVPIKAADGRIFYPKNKPSSDDVSHSGKLERIYILITVFMLLIFNMIDYCDSMDIL